MLEISRPTWVAAALTLALHAGAWRLAVQPPLGMTVGRAPTLTEIRLVEAAPPPTPPTPPLRPPHAHRTRPDRAQLAPAPAPAAERIPLETATQAAPAAPSAADWAFAGTYTLKNSKAYRHSWGRHVRSLMGTAEAGPEQGWVRFRIEIAPDGRLARVDTLWSTSPAVERRARQAIDELPPLPPTPTGQPLVFERTISFTPHALDDTPIYKDDCLPDPDPFRNAFAWDGRSAPPAPTPAASRPPLSPEALAECQRQLPKDTIEAEAAHDARQRALGRDGR